jgi:hypothetical protein
MKKATLVAFALLFSLSTFAHHHKGCCKKGSGACCKKSSAACCKDKDHCDKDSKAAKETKKN